MINEIILGVLLIVTLVLIVMLIRFFQATGKTQSALSAPEPVPITEPETEETEEKEE